MPIHYAVRPEDKFVDVTWSGTITADDLRQSWSTILADPEVLRIGRALTDIRDADLAFSGYELAQVVQAVALPVLKGRDWRSAILVRAPVQISFSHLYQVFAAEFGEDAVFFDPVAARDWLLQGPGERTVTASD
jgi:hypothetical protein